MEASRSPPPLTRLNVACSSGWIQLRFSLAGIYSPRRRRPDTVELVDVGRGLHGTSWGRRTLVDDPQVVVVIQDDADRILDAELVQQVLVAKDPFLQSSQALTRSHAFLLCTWIERVHYTALQRIHNVFPLYDDPPPLPLCVSIELLIWVETNWLCHHF